jgi:hypothetical protein
MVKRLIIVIIGSLFITFLPYFLGYFIEVTLLKINNLNAVYLYICGSVYFIILGVFSSILKRIYYYIKYGI